jgi:hypothetical protein
VPATRHQLLAALKKLLQLSVKRLALHWSHISVDLGFSLLDS